ncbi:smr domain-containing protein [Hirsutella rhossiliensis]|uniref:Smr domain-containing protein n=1 Tax=Hirsutella rhossiliensis TaxID=111463 RepID=A0A9P8MRZ4_9HYPO|nr:smr domain-containing protein [Hirsutella rhossiliensis]KAH0959126.1 smr domain-containing protein [Hirsutella rhossiliensis]
MAIPMTRLGGRALHSGDNDQVEREYDRLRDLARAEADKRGSCFDRSRQAYQSGDGAAAKELSNQGKKHDAKVHEYNRQASDYIFRENNAPGKVEPDSIDLHGQFVDEAERILEERIRADQARGQTHLHAIVGKGNHSAGHVQKIKPKVEALCSELGLKCRTEENAGRIYINLQGGEPLPPQQHPGGHGQQQHPHPQPHPQPPHGQQDETAQFLEKVLPRVLRKLEKVCCVVM